MIPLLAPAQVYGPPPVRERADPVEEALAMRYSAARFAQSTGFRPDPWQVRFLSSRSGRRMLNCSRQVGKSTIVGYGAVHKAIYWPNSLILLLSPGQRQSRELMRKCYDVLAVCQHAPALVTEGLEHAEFTNGSRILALPGNETTVRGFSDVSLLVVDEAARVLDELYMSVLPMLAVSNGQLWTLSSPFGTRGWWYEEYKGILLCDRLHRRREWDYYEVPAPMVPRIPPAFLRRMRKVMGEWWFAQEFMCKFMDAQSAAFGQAEITAAFEGEEVIPWFDKIVPEGEEDDTSPYW